jgi:hypothetical protein
VPKKKLTELEWEIVFRLRCRSKRGEALAAGESKLLETAFREDPERYGSLDAEVFHATTPYGSQPRKR